MKHRRHVVAAAAGIVGFVINVVTGFIFVAGNTTQRPIQYFNDNLAFQL